MRKLSVVFVVCATLGLLTLLAGASAVSGPSNDVILDTSHGFPPPDPWELSHGFPPPDPWELSHGFPPPDPWEKA